MQKKIDHTISLFLQKRGGVLAIDESVRTMNKKLLSHNISGTKENRDKWREIILSSDKIFKEYISGIILNKETIFSSINFSQEKHILGIKVDEGICKRDNVLFTKGLDTLHKNIEEYKFQQPDISFAKWRIAFPISLSENNERIIEANCVILAHYALICHEYNIVPVLEPEVLSLGNHSISECFHITACVLKNLYKTLQTYNVPIHQTILKINMVTPGLDIENEWKSEEIATASVTCLLSYVPHKVPCIAFLSGGQSENNAMNNLRAIANHKNLPWDITFSYGRALQNTALAAWGGNSENTKKAHMLLEKSCKKAFQAKNLL